MTEDPPKQRVITYRPGENRYQWIRREAFDRSTATGAKVAYDRILDEAVDLLRAQSPTDPPPKRRSTK